MVKNGIDLEHELEALIEYLSDEKDRLERSAEEAGKKIEHLRGLYRKTTVVDGCLVFSKKKEEILSLNDLDLEEV